MRPTASQSNPQSRLLAAIVMLDEDAILAALDEGADVNRANEEGETPLVAAITECLELRKSVFNPYPVDDPEQSAMRGRILNVVRLLLDKGANADDRLDGAGDALVWATFANEAPIVRLLLERGANPNFLVDGQWFYDTAESDLLHNMTGDEDPDDATDEDDETTEAFIAYLERKNEGLGGGFSTEVLTMLRNAGAKSGREQAEDTEA